MKILPSWEGVEEGGIQHFSCKWVQSSHLNGHSLLPALMNLSSGRAWEEGVSVFIPDKMQGLCSQALNLVEKCKDNYPAPQSENSLVLVVSWSSFPKKNREKSFHSNSSLGRRLFGTTGKKKNLNYLSTSPPLSLDSSCSLMTHYAEPVGVGERSQLWEWQGKKVNEKPKFVSFQCGREKLH